MKRPEYFIMCDREGWYLAMEDGTEYAYYQNRRDGSEADALKRMQEWEAEDDEAMAECG